MATMAGKRLILSAIMSTVNTWRHPELDPKGIFTLEFYKELARTAERGKLDMLFFGDALSLPGQERGDRIAEHALTRGIEPLTLISALSSHTERIGLICTLNTSYMEPSQIAGKMATADLLSGGRTAWNAVTGTIGKDDDNLFKREAMSHADRYERTDEYIELVKKLWRSGASSEAAFHHRGKWFEVNDGLNIPASEQGQPLIIQAGRSAEFQRQAAKTADAVFTTFSNLEEGRAFYANVKNQMAPFGRNRDDIKILPGLRPIIAATEKEALQKQAYLSSLIHPTLSINSLSQSLGFDLSGYDPNGPLPELPKPGTRLTHDDLAYRSQLAELASKQNLSILELSRKISDSRGHLSFVGTPEKLADYMEEWLDKEGSDGFNIMLPYLPGGLNDFVDLAIPVLQRRGLFRNHYEGATLREHLGLPERSH